MTGTNPNCEDTAPESALAVVIIVLPMVSVVQVKLVTLPEVAEITPEKPFKETTGPVKVVLAIANILYARVACQSVHRPLGRSDKLGYT